MLLSEFINTEVDISDLDDLSKTETEMLKEKC